LIASKTDPTTLTDIQRAGRFFYLQKNCFAGLVVKQHYTIRGAVSQFQPARLRPLSPQRTERLQRVQIESLPYKSVGTVDRSTTCFYMDPPYWRRKLYRHNFTRRGLRTARTAPAQNPWQVLLSWTIIPKYDGCSAAG